MTNEEYLKKTEDFFLRYSEARLGLVMAEDKDDVTTLTQSLVNAELTIANLLNFLNKAGVHSYNENSLPKNVKRLIKALDTDGIYTAIFTPSGNPLDDEDY